MPSTAISAQRATLRVNTASGSPITITGITQADPPVVSAAAHGLSAGDIVQVDGVVGMIEVNGRAYVVANPNTGDFELGGVKAAGYTAYASGGTATEKTMTVLGNAKDFDISPDEANEIDVTNLASIRQEYRIGLAGSWSMSANYDVDAADAGQEELKDAEDDGNARVFTVTLSDGKVFAGVGYVKSMSATGAADGVVSGSLNIRGTGQPTWFA